MGHQVIIQRASSRLVPPGWRRRGHIQNSINNFVAPPILWKRRIVAVGPLPLPGSWYIISRHYLVWLFRYHRYPTLSNRNFARRLHLQYHRREGYTIPQVKYKPQPETTAITPQMACIVNPHNCVYLDFSRIMLAAANTDGWSPLERLALAGDARYVIEFQYKHYHHTRQEISIHAKDRNNTD